MAPPSSFISSTAAAADSGGATPITAVHQDIMETHIISRLDGPSLASAASASPFLHALCSQEKFWAQTCTSTWASVSDPRVSHVISTFPAGHRLFFSDSFPTLHHRRAQLSNHSRGPPTEELISAVDIKYKDQFLLSKVIVTETVTETFACTPLWLELLDPKETVPTQLKFDGEEDDFLAHLEQHVTLSWIVIDPTRKRSVNVSSLRPVSVRRHWMTGEVQLRYATNMAARGENEHVQLRIGVTCVGVEGEDLQIREVSLQVQDMEDKYLNGRDSLVILQDAMEFGERKREGGEKERYEEYLVMKRERRVRKMRRERRLDLVCSTIRFALFLGLVFCILWEKFV